MYPTSGQLVLGFHGCDRTVKVAVLSGRERLRISKNQWDWLGHGVYFWEADPKRALEFARARPVVPLTDPCVLGAVLDLGNCLNLLNRRHLELLKRSHLGLTRSLTLKGEPIPINRKIKDSGDVVLHDLDCAVINYLHEVIEEENQQQFDSVRAAFWEGGEIYHGAGFRELSHIQICIRNPNCIKGYFDPLKRVSRWPRV